MMVFINFLLVFIFTLALVSASLYSGEFISDTWKLSPSEVVRRETVVKFIVALKLRNVDNMQKEFLAVSNPKSSSYGKFLGLSALSQKYGASLEAKQTVSDFIVQNIKGAVVETFEFGDFISVQASIENIEQGLHTQLGWFRHKRNLITRSALRALSPLRIPYHLKEFISFVSLNAPANFLGPKTMAPQDYTVSTTFTPSVSVSGGNEEALISFKVFCGNGTLNNYNPPCTNLDPQFIPIAYQVAVTSYANERSSNLTQLDTDPLIFNFKPAKIYCFNTFSHKACGGEDDGRNCTCTAKLSPLPKYTQLRVNLTTSFASDTSSTSSYSAVSNLFALTDIATAPFLSKLYGIPRGLSVKHGSNQSVAEFYGEFYSNSDLVAFLQLSGLPNATIPESNVYGDLRNNQSDPGGEAQLDVEYIMALAPGADTFFYSMADYNPNDPASSTSQNEGFLEYLLTVNNQLYPPWVHSLSYGDVEADIFNSSHNGSVYYGTRCDQEFMKMGLRGLTVVFSSGDDGIGNNIIRDDPETACQQAWPSWPASSPYVTTIGATQLTNAYLPVCGMDYSIATYLPSVEHLTIQCTGVGETTCSGAFGGVITSGGGFSNVNDRAITAPWQNDAVNTYLLDSNSKSYPPLSYFNASGRAYPDVATYGSNYFVYLNGLLTRESGTSASAPVFAAMVTLWNDIRLANNMPTMGFIAPFLYYIHSTHPEAFQDVVTGNNACGVGRSIETANCCEYSFSASPGWDATTGLGSPNFNLIASLILNNATEFIYFPDSTSTTTEIITNNYDETDDTYKRRANVADLLGIFALLFSLIALFSTIFVCWKSGVAAAVWTGGSNRQQGHRTISTGDNNEVYISPLIDAEEK